MIAIGIALAALWLRLSTLTVESLWWDEVTTLLQSRGSLGELIRLTAADNYPPLHNLLVQLSLRLLGQSEFALRLPSALLGAFTVFLVYWVGSLLGSRLGGLIAAALLAVAGFHLWYSQEARSYALLAFAATAYAGSVLSVTARPGLAGTLAALLSGAALLYSHPYGALTFASIAVAMAALLLRRPGARPRVLSRLLLLAAGSGLLFAPWALVLLNRVPALEATIGWIPEVTVFRVFYYLIQLVTGPAMLVVVLAGLGLMLMRPRPVTALVLLGAWAAGPLLAGIVLSLAVQPLLVQRYLIGSLPALLLIAGLGFARLSGLARPVGLGILGLAGLSSYLWFWPPARTDFRALSRALEERLGPGDCVLMWQPAVIALEHYLGKSPGCLLATTGGYADIDLSGRSPRRLFVLLTPDEPTDNANLDSLGERAGMVRFGEARLLEIVPGP